MTTADPDLHFSSLLASRLCHDVANPAGALSTALDVLNTESDPGMRAHAESLLAESTERLLAVVKFARVAFGSSGGPDGQIDTETIRQLSVPLYQFLKPELRWLLPTMALPKAEARSLMNLLMTAERLAPRAGSEVVVEEDGGSFLLVASGRRAGVPEDVAAALSGAADLSVIEPKAMPALLACRLAASAGKKVVVEASGETVSLCLR